jgi:hypothetical protein
MANSGRPEMIHLLAFAMFALVLAACSGEQKPQLPPTGDVLRKFIAKAILGIPLF